MPDLQGLVSIARCREHGLHGERTECFICGGPVEQVAMVPVAGVIEWLRREAHPSGECGLFPERLVEMFERDVGGPS